MANDFAMTPHERRALFGSSPKPKGYAAQPGAGPAGETCGNCRHHVVRQYSKPYHKCGLMAIMTGAPLAVDTSMQGAVGWVEWVPVAKQTVDPWPLYAIGVILVVMVALLIRRLHRIEDLVLALAELKTWEPPDDDGDDGEDIPAAAPPPLRCIGGRE